ncbi:MULTISPECIES: branched-chain amino acid ABC transporter permease [Bradyrhizobium]|uniref:branched-chain amino acid ABC transporter permease n=1 Tax=Bradyrhizobium elkanii TaxID=29448 RepID=UPI0003F854E9|nr:branched-chain amino acid ABC transporter permease [Bradyrhizobium elkanii]
MRSSDHNGTVLAKSIEEPVEISSVGTTARPGPLTANLIRSIGIIGAVSILPLVMPINIATEILIFGIFAMAANLLIGTAGLYSFGQAAFFGTGGYAAGYLLAHGWTSLPLALVVACGSGGLIAAAVGILSIRRLGIYFMMLTFAFNQLVYYIVYSWRSVTGGEDGLAGIRRPVLELPFVGSFSFDDNRSFYALASVLFLATMIVLVRMVNSPFGLVLAASRQNSRRTVSLGYPVPMLQLVAFVIAGAISGVAGALFAMLYRIMPIDSVHWTGSAYVVFMVVIGGQRNMLGPVIGAAVFIWLQGLFSLVWTRWPLLLGVFVIVIMASLPNGLVGFVSKLSSWTVKGRGQRQC